MKNVRSFNDFDKIEKIDEHMMSSTSEMVDFISEHIGKCKAETIYGVYRKIENELKIEQPDFDASEYH
jgi:hypothetical protein